MSEEKKKKRVRETSCLDGLVVRIYGAHVVRFYILARRLNVQIETTVSLGDVLLLLLVTDFFAGEKHG